MEHGDEESRHDHGRIWAKVNELELYLEKRLATERERVTDKLESIGREVRTYILESTKTMQELVSKTDALHKRLDEHADVHDVVDRKFDDMQKAETEKEKEKREESKVLKREKRGWAWGLGAAVILLMLERVGTLIYTGFKAILGGGK